MIAGYQKERILNMGSAFHPLWSLFERLGLTADCAAIAEFIVMHTPLQPPIELSKASF